MDLNKLVNDFDSALEKLRELNPYLKAKQSANRRIISAERPHKLQKVLVANRAEIARRFFLALHEESIHSVAVVTEEDNGQSWYEFADEVVFIGDKDNYNNMQVLLAAVVLVKANAIYTGYGFVSENAQFVNILKIISSLYNHEIIFMGPHFETMRIVGDKSCARELAREHNIPLFKSSGIFTSLDRKAVLEEADEIGYPVMVKPSAGGAKGMFPARTESELEDAIKSSWSIGTELYGNGSFYLEKYIKNPIHMEVQIFNGWAIGIRKCAVQRRNEKIIEESGHTFLKDYLFLHLLAAAEKMALVSGYCDGCGAGTIEFLIDRDTNMFGFREMNTRLQVEYAVTDQSLGIDLAKWQILYYDGRINDIGRQGDLKYRIAGRNHSIECRIYAEDPENDYLPSPGTIKEMDLPTFNGVRSDFGFGEGDSILPMYDPMIGKIIVNGSSRKEALIRLERVLQEVYIKGVKTNINQLLHIIQHPDFLAGTYTNNLLRDNEIPAITKRKKSDYPFTERRVNKHIIFGAFTEYIRLLHQAINEFMVLISVDGFLSSSSDLAVPCRFTLEYDNTSYLVEFIQTSFDTFYAYVDGIFNGKMLLSSFNDRSDDFLVLSGNRSYRIRVDRHLAYNILRMKDETNKMRYYRMTIMPEGLEDQEKEGVIRSPFQGSFVSFSREDIAVGDIVEAGEPMLVLSSMKMETTICAPVSGKISFIIEDGDMSRLQALKTSDGRVIGKSIQEGTLLVKIESTPDGEQEPGKENRETAVPLHPSAHTLFDILFREDFEFLVMGDIDRQRKLIGDLLLASFLGFIQQPNIIKKIKKLLDRIPLERWKELITEPVIDLIIVLITHYINIRRLFSPEISEAGISFPEELDQYIARWQNSDITLSPGFSELIKALLATYGVHENLTRPEVEKVLMQHMFFLFKISYQFSLEHAEIIKNIVYIIPRIHPPAVKLFSTLKELLKFEQSELDDSLGKFIKKIISRHLPDSTKYLYSNYEGSSISDVMYCLFGDLGSENEEFLLNMCRESIENPGEALIPENSTPAVAQELEKKLAVLQKRYSIKLLFSPLLDILVYRLESIKDRKRCYIAFSFVTYGEGEVNREESIEGAIENTAAIVSAYQAVEKCENNWIEIILTGKKVVFSIEEKDIKNPSSLDYPELKRVCSSALTFFDDSLQIKGILDCETEVCSPGPLKRKKILFYRKNDSIVLDLLQETEERNPYYAAENTAGLNQRLFNKNKWPVDIWAAECFDPGSLKEIMIESIDGTINPDESEGPDLVGGKMLHGTIGGEEACFYMKDSRINGGATGNKEGLKYTAAAYISYLMDWPFYVWNDSAGANIKEGVVSLNRGAEGFMLNTLLVERVTYEKFRRYTTHANDPVLRELFHELDSRFSFPEKPLSARGERFQFIVVGIGSSAGLDVYGASQAAIQLMLDSEQSYRVLTGSNVIKTVIGEQIENYDIGGAKILGQWTGIVDLIAMDKVHLICSVHKLHRFFCTSAAAGFREGILRSSTRYEEVEQLEEEHNNRDTVVISESIIRNNVDYGEFWTFKDQYYASGSLLGGFATIGGRRVLVMGARTHAGIRSFPSIVKARDLLRIAHRTVSHQVFIFGKKWQEVPDYHENMSMRSRYDLMNTIGQNTGIRIHVITDVEGLSYHDVNSAADVIIFINDKETSPFQTKFIENNASFIVASFEEAFDCAYGIIDLLNSPEELPVVVPKTPPSVPEEPSQPFDMIESVIEPVFDEGSFVEFFREMNDPMQGPNLITGLARLDGTCVGIIADQPLQKGGGADALGTEKFRFFTEFLNAKNIPLVMLSNSSGFVPGSNQERFRIQAIGAESLDVNILGQIPVVSVVLNQVYGGRLIHAFNKFLRPGIVNLALDRAIMAVIGVDAAFDLFHQKEYNRLLSEGKEKKAEELRTTFCEEFLEKGKAANDAVHTDLIDWLIPDVAGLRGHIIKGMKLAVERCRVFTANEMRML
ncbi:MAG: hypothetical protein GY754_36980 [bacterium]|nr:hypothetical protein [bacterium]